MSKLHDRLVVETLDDLEGYHGNSETADYCEMMQAVIAEANRRIAVAGENHELDGFCPCCGESDCGDMVASTFELESLFGGEDEICKSCFSAALLKAAQIDYCCDSMHGMVNLIYSAMDCGYVDRAFAERCMFVAAVSYSVPA